MGETELQYGEMAYTHPRRKKWQDECPVGDLDMKGGWCFSLSKGCRKLGMPEKFKKCPTYLGYCTGFANAECERYLDYRKRQKSAGK